MLGVGLVSQLLIVTQSLCQFSESRICSEHVAHRPVSKSDAATHSALRCSTKAIGDHHPHQLACEFASSGRPGASPTGLSHIRGSGAYRLPR